MYPFIGQKILSGVKKAVGLSVRLTNKEDVSYSVAIVQKKHNKLELLQKFENITDVGELKSLLPTGSPVFVNIDDWGVLVKKSNPGGEGSHNDFHLGDSDEFISSSFTGGDSNPSFVAIMRLGLFQKTLSPLHEAGIEIFSVSIGPFEAGRLLTMFYAQGEFGVGNRLIRLENGSVVDCAVTKSSMTDVVEVGDDNIPVGIFAAYSMVSLFFITGTLSELKGNDRFVDQFLYKRLTKLVGWGSLLVLLAALLVNFALFSNYNSKLNQLSSEFELRKALFERMESQSVKLKQKKELVHRGDLAKETNFAYYADRLATLLPEPIVLQQMAFQPIQRKLANGREAAFLLDEVQVSGETPNSIVLREWMDRIGKEQWVEKVEMTFYGQEKVDQPALFKLQILTVHEQSE